VTLKQKYFFELSGEHGTMPSAEAVACIRAESDEIPKYTFGPGYVIAEFDASLLDDIAGRIAMTQKLGRHLGSFDISDTSGFKDISIPEGTFAVRARRFEGMMEHADTQDLTKKLGTILSEKNNVSLKEPDIEVRMFLSDRVHMFICEKDIDRTAFEERKVGERPFFSPISLHPKYARASINLTCVKRGGTVLDPFCGTGGIVMEAAEMGMKVIASDFDERMVVGCLENMEHYGLKMYDHEVLDIGDVPERFTDVDAIVTDPPYGRSTHTAGEDVISIHRRALGSVNECLKDDGKATMVLPYQLNTNVMNVENVFIQRVHRSLSRYYHVLGKRP